MRSGEFFELHVGKANGKVGKSLSMSKETHIQQSGIKSLTKYAYGVVKSMNSLALGMVSGVSVNRQNVDEMILERSRTRGLVKPPPRFTDSIPKAAGIRSTSISSGKLVFGLSEIGPIERSVRSGSVHVSSQTITTKK